jgi:hypothetical protein
MPAPRNFAAASIRRHLRRVPEEQHSLALRLWEQVYSEQEWADASAELRQTCAASANRWHPCTDSPKDHYCGHCGRVALNGDTGPCYPLQIDRAIRLPPGLYQALDQHFYQFGGAGSGPSWKNL